MSSGSSRAVADGGHVVGEGVEPDVDDVLFFAGADGGGLGDGDAPGEGVREMERSLRAPGRTIADLPNVLVEALLLRLQLCLHLDVAAEEAEDFVAADSGWMWSSSDSMRSMSGPGSRRGGRRSFLR